MTTPFTRTYKRLRRVRTRRGDTPQRIAARELADAARWIEIVAINALKPPYITDSLSEVGPGVVLSGSTLQIPDDGAAITSDAAPDPETAFLVDMALVNGRLEAGEDGDFALVSGVANLRQALRIRLDTELGELLFHQGYGNGVHALRGQNVTPSLLALANSLTKRCVKADPRISDTQDFTASASGDGVRVRGYAVANDGTPNDIDVVA